MSILTRFSLPVMCWEEHQRFHRRGADLFLKMDLSLTEAISGFRRVIEHLDGRRFVVRSHTPLACDSTMAVKGQGMPLKGQPFSCGNLFLLFKVCFPKQLTAAHLQAVRQLEREESLEESRKAKGEAFAQVAHFVDLEPP